MLTARADSESGAAVRLTAEAEECFRADTTSYPYTHNVQVAHRSALPTLVLLTFSRVVLQRSAATSEEQARTVSRTRPQGNTAAKRHLHAAANDHKLLQLEKRYIISFYLIW